ncbi:hypothetical protein Peur_006209 [Populus x canadensis]
MCIPNMATNIQVAGRCFHNYVYDGEYPAVCFYYGLDYVRWFDLSGLLILASGVFQSEPFEINGAGVLSLVLRYLLTLHPVKKLVSCQPP